MREEESMQRCISCCMLGSVGSRAMCVCVVCAALFELLQLCMLLAPCTQPWSHESVVQDVLGCWSWPRWNVSIKIEFLASFMFSNSFIASRRIARTSTD